MKTDPVTEKQLQYIQRRLKVSREHIIETCRVSKVSLDKIVRCLENSQNELNRLTIRV